MKKNTKYNIYFYTILLLSIISPFNKNKSGKVNEVFSCLTSIPYSNGTIYITDNSNNILLNNKNIQVVDERHIEDCNIKVLDSYKINSLKEMREIIYILKDYNDNSYNDNSRWNRSAESMEREWLIHNVCYHMNIFISRSKNVDFNNSDELIYLKLIK